MENAFTSQLLSDPSAAPDGLPDTLRMQLGPFNPQIQDSKAFSIHSLHASAFRLRYGANYPRFPAHLIQHLQPQLFPTTVDQRLHFPPGAFRSFTVPTSQSKLFPSAFAPPLKSSETGNHDSLQDVSPGVYVSSYYNNENEEDASFRSNTERDIDFQCGDQNSKLELSRSALTPTPSPQSSSTKEEKNDTCNGKVTESIEVENSDNRNLRRSKISLDPTSCPICGIMVLLGEAETHFFKELEKLSHISSMSRDKKYVCEKFYDVRSCFPSFGNSTVEENGSESGIPRGRWETYQRIKSNRLGRLRIKNRKKKNGDPVCPVCNEKIQGSVEDINLHVEHCLKKHSDEVEEEEEENIDVEGDSEVYGEYEWTGRHLIRATTFLVGGFAAGLLTTAASANHQSNEKDERIANSEEEDCSRVTPVQVTDAEAMEVDSVRDKPSKNRDKNVLGICDNDYDKFSKTSTRA